MKLIYHIPALLHETINGMQIQPNGVYVDVTFGGGGHSRAILEEICSHPLPNSTPEGRGGKGKLYSFDQDLDAYRNAMQSEGSIFEQSENWQFVHSNFRYLRNLWITMA